jgi:hypothetical protein
MFWILWLMEKWIIDQDAKIIRSAARANGVTANGGALPVKGLCGAAKFRGPPKLDRAPIVFLPWYSFFSLF